MTTVRISLDSTIFAGRLRTFNRRVVVYQRRSVVRSNPRLMQDVRTTQVALENANKRKSSQKQVFTGMSNGQGRHSIKPRPRTERSTVLKRGTVHAPARRHKTHPRFSSKKALLILAAVLFLFGVGVGIDGLRANKQVVAQVQGIQQTYANDTASTGADDPDENTTPAAIPAEDDKPDVDAYKVAADLPRALYIPKIDVEARVLHLGTTRDGSVASPSNILDAGWFKESAKPGQSGAMLIDGHVHGPTKPGVFVNLKKLKPGDEIQLERGDGTRFTYRVTSSKTYPADNVDMGAALRSAEAGKPGLNVITCTGEIDKATNHYKDRLVVFAVQK